MRTVQTSITEGGWALHYEENCFEGKRILIFTSTSSVPCVLRQAISQTQTDCQIASHSLTHLLERESKHPISTCRTIIFYYQLPSLSIPATIITPFPHPEPENQQPTEGRIIAAGVT